MAALLSALAGVAACSSSTEPNTCLSQGTGVGVDPSTTPLTIFWSPSCPASLVLVETGGLDTAWALSSPANTIRPNLRYGVVPAGAQQIVAPKPLLKDTTYEVSAWMTLGGGTAYVLGVARYTP